MLALLVEGGLDALHDYIATHVLTCLVPAFLLAGAMVTFISRETVLAYLGGQTNKLKSFSLAGIASFLIAACSCTVIPVAGGLYFTGAGIGAAFVVLWVAPAANVLALVYTGNVLGPAMAVARIVGALATAFAVGAVMSAVFGKEERAAGAAMPRSVSATAGPAASVLAKKHVGLLLLILLSLLLPNYLVRSGPYWHKTLVWAVLTAVVAVYAVRFVSLQDMKRWLRETWWFVRIIFPLLLGGVFLVGVIGKLLPETWIREWLGGNGFGQSFLATLIGAITYFATMTEAPFVDTLMKLGMGKGPALALLLTGPGISLPNWLAVARVFGVKKALVYVPMIVACGTLAGFVYGLL